MTPYAEVIGDPVSGSKSPAIHQFWLAKSGVAGDYRAQHVTADELGAYIAARSCDPAWRGCNVTMPHKQHIIALLDTMEPAAERIGAVNLVRMLPDGRLSGANTDAVGFIEPLRDRLAEAHWFRMARVIGTGGAARAIVTALAGEGFTLVLAGRDENKGRALLDELVPHGEHHAVELAHFAQSTDFAFDDRGGCLDLVVNASPLGMRGQAGLAFDWSHAPPGSIAYDIVTDPVETPFLIAARAAGHPTIDGLAMLIGQAAASFPLFFGAAAPRDHDAELRAMLAP